MYQTSFPKPKYPALFDGTLGAIKGVTAKFVVKENAKGPYLPYKPHPVPYNLRDNVAAELSRLEKEGVVKKVERSDWATPIVCTGAQARRIAQNLWRL